MLVAVVSCAALGLGAIAVVESRDSVATGGIDVEELAEQIVEETEASYEEEFGAGIDPDFPGAPMEGEPFSMFTCTEAEPATGPGLGPQPRSPDELNPVLDVGEAAVVSYRPLECEHPVVFRIRVDDVRVQDT
nr:hypothetical protein [Micromonospora sp. DSM 115978]